VKERIHIHFWNLESQCM